MATDPGSGDLDPRTASVVPAARFGRSAGQPQAARNHRVALLLIGLGFLRSRRVVEAVIIGVVGLAALAALARENQTRNRARMAAWLKRKSAP